jgi:hypothetical protein
MPVGPYTGPHKDTANGVATVFAYQFRILDEEDLVVLVDGEEQILGVDYTVSGVNDSGGGNVTFAVAPANGSQVVRHRLRPYERDTDYQRSGSFDEETVDRDYDSLEMQIQQLREAFDRTVHLDITTEFEGELILPEPQAGYLIGWNAAATGLQNYAPADVAAGGSDSAIAANWNVDHFFDAVDYTSGTTDELTLSGDPITENNTFITFDGTLQHKDTYSVSGAVITFDAPIPLGVLEVEVAWGSALGIAVPGDGSVDDDALADGAVTTPKLADDSVTTDKILDGTILLEDLNAEIIAYINSIGSGASSGSTGSVRGVAGYNNSTNPDNQYDVSADVIVVRKPSNGETIVIQTPDPITIDIDVAGPIINGRDQAGTFTVSTFARLYWIYNETTQELAGIVSAQPPSVGPTLPAGYTHWAYIGTVKINGSGNLLKMRLVGDTMFYLTTIGAVLTNGNATVETTIDMSPFVPEEASTYQLYTGTAITTNGSGVLEFNVDWRLISGVRFKNVGFTLVGLTGGFEQNFSGGALQAIMPNVNQEFIYITQTTLGSGIEHNISCGGFTIPNGG